MGRSWKKLRQKNRAFKSKSRAKDDWILMPFTCPNCGEADCSFKPNSVCECGGKAIPSPAFNWYCAACHVSYLGPEMGMEKVRELESHRNESLKGWGML